MPFKERQKMGKLSFLEGELSLEDDVLNVGDERQWVNSNFTVTPVYGAALVLGIAALVGVGFAALYVAQFSFQGRVDIHRDAIKGGLQVV